MTFSDDIVRALGRITINFQALEARLAFYCWYLIGPDPNIGMIVTSQVAFGRLCDLIDSLYRYRVQDPLRIETIAALLRRASQAEQQRNALIHSYWVRFDGDDEGASTGRIKITARRSRGLNPQFHEDITAESVSAVADELALVATDLLQFMADARQRGEITYPTSA